MNTLPFGFTFNKSCLGRNKMATILKMAALNIIFRIGHPRWFIVLKMLQAILKLTVNLGTDFI